jgi:glycerol-3-phosphate acyltransferase PlsY
MPYVLCLALGYLVGSFPTAFLLVRWKTRTDIRESGSGNVGALNTLEVTGSKGLGALVLVIDILKGALAVFLTYELIGNSFEMLGTGGIGAVLGHNYSPWIKLKGGRGLATAAGVVLSISWSLLLLWGSIWLIVHRLSRNVHVANVAALLVGPIVVWMNPLLWSSQIFSIEIPPTDIALFFSILCFLILIRHIEPILQLWQSSHKSISHEG